MSSNMPPNEPSNHELKALLDRLMTDSGQRHTEAVKGLAELHTVVKHQSTQLMELTHRVNKVERDAKRALDQQETLEGDLLAEVGALAANDKAQTQKLTRIEEETRAQSKDLQELLDDKKALAAQLKLLKYIGIIVPVVASAVLWIMQHVKL